MNSPLLLELFNNIKNTNLFPVGWTHGRVVLIHKSGPKEFITNYRPLTVNIAFVGVYSRILNNRLSNLVESHDLLGESQNGFRPGRSCGDNSFVLNTILWKENVRIKMFIALRGGINKKNWYFSEKLRNSETPPPPSSNLEAPVFSDKEILELARPPPF